MSDARDELIGDELPVTVQGRRATPAHCYRVEPVLEPRLDGRRFARRRRGARVTLLFEVPHLTDAVRPALAGHVPAVTSASALRAQADVAVPTARRILVN